MANKKFLCDNLEVSMKDAIARHKTPLGKKQMKQTFAAMVRGLESKSMITHACRVKLNKILFQ